MSESDRHINFRLMRDHILALQDAEQPRGGKKYWRSLEELADTPQFREFVAREFPQQAEGWNDPVERRTFLKLMGASLALAGLSGCVFQPPEKIVPYVKQPEEHVPGKVVVLRDCRAHARQLRRRFSCAATKAGRQRSRAIRSIRTTVRLIFRPTIRSEKSAASALRTFSRKRRS